MGQIHRTTFARQAANLWKFKERLQSLLQRMARADRQLSIIDSFPVPVCRFARAKRCKRLAGIAAFGYDELAEGFPSIQTFYGLRGHVRIAWPGVIMRAELASANTASANTASANTASANTSDVHMAPHVLEGAEGVSLADRNYWRPRLSERLQGQGLQLLAPFKTKTHETSPWPITLTWKRRRIETVIGQLTERFRAKKVWARDRWHIYSRWIRKITSHTMGLLLCRQQGPPPLRFAELITD